MKIVYCLNSIRGLGGIQRVTAIKANALAEIEGNIVYVVVTDNWEKHQLVQCLSSKVNFINLYINYYADDYKSGFHRFISNLRVFRHFKRLQKVISEIEPDILVSVGQSEKYIIPFLRTKAVRIREIHFNSNYREYTYKSKFAVNILQYVDFHLFSKLYDKYVLLTEEDKKLNFPSDSNFVYMYNPSTFQVKDSIDCTKRGHYVIAVGRLSLQKNFQSLLRAWAIVAESVKDWKLVILGEGPERKKLESLVDLLGINESVLLKGYSNEVDKELEHASIFVLSSIYEGFGLVILEAMSKGLPVVSYTCPYGPRDIIKDGKSGFLVPLNNEKMLAERIVRLIKDKELRVTMGSEALRRVRDFDISVIVKQWMDLFKREIEAKSCK